MGYFPNGTSNEFYTGHFCANCRNWRYDEETDTYGCPIMDLHLLWNYDAVGSDADLTKKSALNMFIPIAGIENQECKMFLPHNPNRCLETMDMFDSHTPHTVER